MDGKNKENNGDLSRDGKFNLLQRQQYAYSFRIYKRVLKREGSVNLSKPVAHYSGIRVVTSSVVCIMICRSFFVILSFFFWPLYCCIVLSFDISKLFLSANWGGSWQFYMLSIGNRHKYPVYISNRQLWQTGIALSVANVAICDFFFLTGD